MKTRGRRVLPEIIGSGLEEARLSLIFQQVTATFNQFGFDGSIRLEVSGKLLSDYLEATKPLPPEASDPVRVVPSLSFTGRPINWAVARAWVFLDWHRLDDSTPGVLLAFESGRSPYPQNHW